MRKALATLPWVEQDSIKTDTSKQEVRFKLNDRSKWNEEDVRKALKDQSFPAMTVKNLPSQ